MIEPLKEKANHIKNEVLPNVKEQIKTNFIPKLKELYEQGKDKVVEMNLPEKFNKLKDVAKVGAKVLLEKRSVAKEFAISAFRREIEIGRGAVSKVIDKAKESLER